MQPLFPLCRWNNLYRAVYRILQKRSALTESEPNERSSPDGCPRVNSTLRIGTNEEQTHLYLFPFPTAGENLRKRGMVRCTISTTSKPPIRRWSGWGEMFFMKTFPRVRSGLPPQPSEAGAGGKEASSGMRELSPEAEAKDKELVSLSMGGNVFSGGKNVSAHPLDRRKRQEAGRLPVFWLIESL